MQDQAKTMRQLIADNEELRGQVANLRQEVAGCSSDNRRLESALRASELRHKALLYNLPEKLFWKDTALAYVSCNHNYAQDFALTPEQLVGKTDYDLYPPDMAEKYRADDRRIMDSAGTEEIEEAYCTPTGKQCVVRTVKTAFRDAEGNVAGILGVFSDITARKEAEKALREKEAQLIEAQEVASVGFYVLQIATGEFTTSSVLDRLFDIPAQYEKTIAGWARLVHPDERQVMLDYLLKEVVGKKKAFDRQYRIIRDNDKQVRWVHGLGRLQLDEDGQPVSMLGTVQDITDRKRAEDDLRESEQRYRLFMESIPQTVWRSDPEGNVLDCNRHWSEYTGQTPEEAKGDGWSKAVHPEDLARVGKQVREDLARGETYQCEQRLRRAADGAYRWHLARGVPVKDDEGKVAGWIGGTTDIHDQKCAEESLKKVQDELEAKVKERTADLQKANEELTFFRRLADASAQGFGMADMDGCLTYINPTLCRLAGVAKPEDAIGKHLAAYYPEKALPRREKELLPALLTEGHWEGELVFESAGKTTHTLQNSFLIRDENGNPSRLASVVTDITERKRAEEALRQSERRFRNYFEQGLIGMAVTSLDKRWLEVNDRLCEMLGYSRAELVETDWAALTHPDDLEPNLRLFTPLLAGEIEHFTLNKRYFKKDGSTVYTTIYTRAFRREDATIDHIVTLIEDITARKQAQEALERERQSLWRMLQASDHERQIISYEIHDGLAQYLAAAGMQFQTQDALRENSPCEAQKAYETAVELVRQAHFEARRLISEVRPPVIDEIGLETAISHLVHEQRRHGGPKMECHSDVQFGRLPSILENAIYRIAQEALTNACKHSRSKKVTVAMTQEGQDVRLEVRDWGIGFDPAAVETGHFGLEGIRQRVRLLGGRLYIESEPGSGTLVQVVVPIVERQDDG